MDYNIVEYLLSSAPVKKFIDEMPGGFLIYRADKDEEIIYANEALLRLFGCDTLEEFRKLTGNSFRGVVHPEDLEEVEESIWEQIAGSKYDLDYVEYRIIRKDGEIRYVDDYGHFVRSETAGDVFYVFIGDATEKRNLQNRLLESALNEAEQANHAKSTFLSNMSHDIRTPMNAIVGYAILAKHHLDDKEKVLKYLNMITSSSDILLQLLNNVFEVVGIESAQIYLEEDKCDILEVLNNIQAVMSLRAEEKNIVIALDTAGVRHSSVYGDQQKLSQTLLYLIDNAIKYTDTNGHIRIAAFEQEMPSKDTASYQFVVEDDGIGISEEYLERVFEPFERERSTTTLGGVYGTGLGLTIAKKMVEMMGGNIALSSTVGEGTKFTVTIQFRLQAQNLSAAENPDVHEGQRHILIVDDNEINLEIGVEVLKDAGYLVDTATDGSIAVEKVKHARPGTYDLILMDLQMPVMNGCEAARALRAIPDPKISGIPIVALSANAFSEDKQMALGSGMNAHLPKPLDVEQLYELLGQMLGEGQREQI